MLNKIENLEIVINRSHFGGVVGLGLVRRRRNLHRRPPFDGIKGGRGLNVKFSFAERPSKLENNKV
jgi:hypothetical protein